MRFIRVLTIGLLMALLLSVFSPAYALQAAPSASSVLEKAYVVNNTITLSGKLNISKSGSSYVAILKLDTPQTFIVGAKTYANANDIRVYVPNRLNGKDVRVTGRLMAGTTAARPYVLKNASASEIPAAKSVFMSQNSASVAVSGVVQLSAFVKPDSARQNVTWSTSNSKVATVSSSGAVTGKAKGSAVITAKTANGKKATCSVNVYVPVASVKLSTTCITMVEKKLFQLTATVLPSNAYNKNVIWSSSNTNVATVNANGLVTAKAPGTAKITATAAADECKKSASCTVTVNAAPALVSVDLAQNSLYLAVNKSANVPFVVTPATALMPTIRCRSLDTSVVAVDRNNIMTGKKIGIAPIEISYNGITKRYLCCVTSKAVPNVTLKATDIQVYLGRTLLPFPALYSAVTTACPGGRKVTSGNELVYYFNGYQSNSVFVNALKANGQPDTAKQTFKRFWSSSSASKTFRGITIGDGIDKLLTAYGRSGTVREVAGGREWKGNVAVGGVVYTLRFDLNPSTNKVRNIYVYR